MILTIRRTWILRRFKVYSLGHTEGEAVWLATFRYRQHANDFIRHFMPGYIGDADIAVRPQP